MVNIIFIDKILLKEFIRGGVWMNYLIFLKFF